MIEASRWISATDSCHISGDNPNDGGGEAEKKTAPTEPACPTASSAKQSSLGKRKSRPDENEDDDDEAEDENDGESKRKKYHQEENDNSRVRFACPFRKHDPQTYAILRGHARCAVAKLPSVSRVKEHLFRCHLAPIHCPRCWRVFDSSQELESHMLVQAERICDVGNSGNPPKGITAEQAKVLRSRKKSSARQSEEDRWMEIYQVLFPGEPRPKSPYFDEVQDETSQAGLIDANHYKDYAQRAFADVFRSQLDQLAAGPQGHTLEDLICVFQRCQDTLLREYSSQATVNDDNSAGQTRACQPTERDLASSTPNLTSIPIISSHVSRETSPTNTDCYPPIVPEPASIDITETSLTTSLLDSSSFSHLGNSGIDSRFAEQDWDHGVWNYVDRRAIWE